MTLTKPTRAIADMGIGLRTGGPLILNGGEITLTEGSHNIDTEAGAPTDQLTRINPGPIDDGGLVLIYATDDARTIEVVSDADNIELQNGGSVFLNNVGASLLLRRDGLVFRDLVTSSVSSGLVFIEEIILAGVEALDFTGLDFVANASFKINIAATTSGPTANSNIAVRFDQGAGFLEGALDYASRFDGSSPGFTNGDSQINMVNLHATGADPILNSISGVIELFPPFGPFGQHTGAHIVSQIRKVDGSFNQGQAINAGHLRLNNLDIEAMRIRMTVGQFDDIRCQLWGLRK